MKKGIFLSILGLFVILFNITFVGAQEKTTPTGAPASAPVSAPTGTPASTTEGTPASTTEGTTSDGGKKCNGIKLNTDFPLVGDCIELKKGDGTNTLNVFQEMVGGLMRIVSSVIMVVCFIMIIIAGIKRSANDPKTATDLIKKVAITIFLLGLSGVILKVINPTFFS